MSNSKKLLFLFRGNQSNNNDIGIAGSNAFGVGIAPAIPSYMEPLEGTFLKGHDNYGNYRVKTDQSIMVWIPAFYYRITNVTDAPYYGTKVEIASIKKYALPESAALDGYALHRAFIDGGVVKKGFFADKYKWCLSGDTWSGTTQLTGFASSIRNSNPITSSSEALKRSSNNYAGAFSNCISNSRTPVDNYSGAWSAAKSRGSDFFVMSAYQQSALALLSLAHGQASSSTANCAWYHTTNNFPKGNNNYGADVNDATVTYAVCTDAYWQARNEARQNGGANTLAKTTHNGLNCGVADLKGNQWEIVHGMTSKDYVTKAMTAISREAECVVTSANHGFTNGQVLFFQGSASAEWNAKFQYYFYKVSDATTDTYKLKSTITDVYINTSALTADYTSGFTAYFQNFYTWKNSVVAKDIQGGSASTAYGHFNSTWIGNNMDIVTIPLSFYIAYFGNTTSQVLSAATSGNGYLQTSLGMPTTVNSYSPSGSNNFGQDYYVTWYVGTLCLIRSGSWDSSTGAGVWCAYLYNSPGFAYRYVSARTCLYV